jgi:ATPase family associated with various cellular activities (AAA)
MRSMLLWLTSLIFLTGIYGQAVKTETFIRSIKVNTDSLPPLKAPLLKKLEELNAASKSGDRQIRLIVSSADKQTAPDICRWLAIRKKQDMEKVFSRAAAGNMILFFDETDALFGKRSGEGAGTDDQQKVIDYFIQQVSLLKGTVIIRCTAENCIPALAKLRFTGISG